MKGTFCCLIFLFYNLFCFAENKDSLDDLLKKANTPKETFGILKKAATTVGITSAPRSLIYARQAYEAVKNSTDKETIVAATNFLGQNFLDVGNYDSAFYYLDLAVMRAEQCGDKADLGATYINLEGGYAEINNYAKAEEYNSKAFAIYKSIRSNKGILKCLIGLGELKMGLKKYDSCLKYDLEALALNNDSSIYITEVLFNNIGIAYVRLKNYPKSLEYQNKLYHLAIKTGDSLSIASVLESKGGIYTGLKQFDSAEIYLKSAIDIAKKVKIDGLVEAAYNDLGNLYEVWGKPKLALEWVRRYYELKDSVFNKDNAAHIAELEEQYQSNEKQAKIDLQDAQIKTSRQNFYFISVGFLFIAIIALILFMTQRRSRLLNRQLTQQKAEITIEKEKSEQLNSVKDKIFSVISHDLRSPLNNINASLSLLRKKDLTRDEFDSLTGRLGYSVQATSNLLDNLLVWSSNQLKGIPLHLRPINLKEVVDESISLYKNIALQKKLIILTKVDEDVFANADLHVLLFVLRNLLDNAVKFSNPGNEIVISTEIQDHSIALIIRDHGIGMNEEQLRNLFTINNKIRRNTGTANEQGSGLGLSLCYELIKKMDGDIRVESKQDDGTSIFVTFPSVITA